MSADRRDTLRVPVSQLITELYRDRPFAASITNLSATGFYTVQPLRGGIGGAERIQVEIPLPEIGDSIWAAGEVVHEDQTGEGLGTGIRFVAIAEAHRRQIAEVVEARRRAILAQMLAEIRWRKALAEHPSPYSAPPPPPSENTVRMYLIEEEG